MLSGYNSLRPVEFLYEHDNKLVFTQKAFATQQGLQLNLVNALSGCQDETILNYSNIFLTDLVKINDIVYIKDEEKKLISFPTYFALSAFPDVTTETLYAGIIPNETPESEIVYAKSLSAADDYYFVFKAVNGLQCRLSVFNEGQTKNLTVDFNDYDLYFSVENDNIKNLKLNIFEYSIDRFGYLKLFFRYEDQFYYIRYDAGKLRIVDATTTTSLSTDIIATAYRKSDDVVFKNDFIYYDAFNLKPFIVDSDRSIIDIPQNHIVYFNYESGVNFVSGAKVLVDFYKNKNLHSNNYFINDTLPFANRVANRKYRSILSKYKGETFYAPLQLGYNYYTQEFLFEPDKTTPFTVGESIYPYTQVNINDTSLINNGAYGGSAPIFSDKVIKQKKTGLGQNDGTYLYSWLYTDSQQLTSYWLDRFYYPQNTTFQAAFSGSIQQLTNFTGDLSAYLATNDPSASYNWYDIKSSLTFEPSGAYQYVRIGPKSIDNVVNSFPLVLSAFDVRNTADSFVEASNQIDFDSTKFGSFVIDDKSFSIAFDINTPSVSAINANLVVGNNFNEGISVYRSGKHNVFTPGSFVNTFTGVDFYSTSLSSTWTVNVSSYVGAQVKVLDVVHDGLDHDVKILYQRVDNGVAGLLEISVAHRAYNFYEFPELVNTFSVNDKILIYNKVQTLSGVWYLLREVTQLSAVHIDYKNNEFKQIVALPLPDIDINSVVLYNNALSTLSGFRGFVLNDIGVSKKNSSLYYKDLNNNSEYEVLSVFGGSIFDIAKLDDKLFIQTNGEVGMYDINKRKLKSYTNTTTVSGLKIDFINDGFRTKLLTLGADKTGLLVFDKFDLDTQLHEQTYTTNYKINKRFFGEFNVPRMARYQTLYGVGIVNQSFISGGVENEYTLVTPIDKGMITVPINALVAGVSDDCGFGSVLSGSAMLLDNSVFPTDFKLNLFRADSGSLLATMSADGKTNKLVVTYSDPIANVPYSVQCVRENRGTIGVAVQFDIVNGSFFNGSFRNNVIGSQYIDKYGTGYSAAFFAFNPTHLFPENNFTTIAQAYQLDIDYALPMSTVYMPQTYIMGALGNNPLTDFFNAGTTPNIAITVDPAKTSSTIATYTSGFSAVLMEFTANTLPLYAYTLSGYPLQTPVNFTNVYELNRFGEGDFVVRADLRAGNNFKNKQAVVMPFSAPDIERMVVVFDAKQASVQVYSNGLLACNMPLSSDTFYTSYFNNNNYGLGTPYIDNVAHESSLPEKFGIANFRVYSNALSHDEVKFDYLRDKIIDAVNFDLPAGTRNGVETVKAFNKYSIPGRKNNDIKIYIRNVGLAKENQQKLTDLIKQRLATVLPVNIANVVISYTDE